MGSTGSTLPEHPRFTPGTRKATNLLKDVWTAVKIAQYIIKSLLVPVAKYYDAPNLYVSCITVNEIYKKILLNKVLTLSGMGCQTNE